MLYEVAYRLGKVAQKSARSLSNSTSRLFYLAHREARKRPDLPREERLWAYRNGFLSEGVPLFDLNEDNVKSHLSYRDWTATKDINGEAGAAVNDKLLLYHVLLPEYRDVLPPLYGFLREGKIQPTPLSEPVPSDVGQCIEATGGIITRPLEGAGGRDVRVFRQDENGYHIDGNPASVDDVRRVTQNAGTRLVTGYVQQADYADGLYSNSANTVRMLTMIDPDTREAFIPAVVHRIGSDESTPVDNWSRGGIVSKIDRETGELSAAISYPYDGTRRTHDTHPDTGARLEGTSIPQWASIREEMLDLAERLGDLLPYVGWDVLVTDHDGSYVIIEGNNWPDIDIIQPHYQLLDDERARRFYEHHDII